MGALKWLPLARLEIVRSIARVPFSPPLRLHLEKIREEGNRSLVVAKWSGPWRRERTPLQTWNQRNRLGSVRKLRCERANGAGVIARSPGPSWGRRRRSECVGVSPSGFPRRGPHPPSLGGPPKPIRVRLEGSTRVAQREPVQLFEDDLWTPTSPLSVFLLVGHRTAGDSKRAKSPLPPAPRMQRAPRGRP